MSFDTIRMSDIRLYACKQDVYIIDLRDREDYEKGHIPNAINIPYEELEKHKVNLPKNGRYILYCEHGNLSLLAARDMLKEGYHIKSAYGGICAYKGPLECN